MPKLREPKEELELEKKEPVQINDDAPVKITLPEEGDEKGEPIIEAADLEVEKKVEKKEPKEKPVVKAKEKKEDAEEDIPGVKELKSQLSAARQAAEEERTRRVEAEKIALKQQEESSKFRTEAEKSQYDMVVNAMSGVENEAALAQRAYEAAIAESNWPEASKAQRLMSRAEAKLLQLEEGKAAMEARQERAKTEKPEIKVIQPDPFDQYVSQFSQPTQQWLRSHPQSVKDPRLNAKTIAAHHDAVNDGLTVDTPEYFERIEEELGLRKRVEVDEDDQGDDGRVLVSEHSRAKPYAAAPSRGSTPSSNGDRGRNSSRSITLTPDQRSAARAAGVSDVEYATQLMALQNEGVIGRPN